MKTTKNKQMIKDSAPWMIQYLKDKNDANRYSYYDKKEIYFVCPDCGAEFKKRIDTVYAHGLDCPCGDNWSYPNKFIYSLLMQLPVKHYPEKKFNWSDSRKYDEYVLYKGKSIIVEMHGEQHYSKPISNKGRTLEEEIKNDRYKRSLAIENNIDYYFEIDARKSKLDYIKESIIQSGLLKCLEISENEIDWIECDKFATGNFCKLICLDFKKSQNKDIKEFAKKWHLGVRTIRKYLNKGNEFGWCVYNAYSNKVQNLRDYSDKVRKKVFCKTISKFFDSATEAAKYLNLPDAKNNGRSIRNSIKYHRPYLGYEFEYVI